MTVYNICEIITVANSSDIITTHTMTHPKAFTEDEFLKLCSSISKTLTDEYTRLNELKSILLTRHGFRIYNPKHKVIQYDMYRYSDE